MKNTKEIFVVSIILNTLLFIFFWKTATLQELFITPDLYDNDIVNLNYPYKNFLSECLKQKKSFLWTSDIYCGYPIHAEGQGGFCYPLNLVLFRFLPTYVAFNYSVILAFFLTGIFTYLYARVLDLSKTSSFFSAIAFMFSGFFVLHVRHLNLLQAACWFPLLLFLIEKFFKTDKMIYIVLTGIIFAFQILTGYPQVAYYSFSTIVLYLLFGIFRRKKIVSVILSIFIIGIVGIGLSAIQWIPTYELVQLSVRKAGVDYKFATDWAYKFKDFIMFVFPLYYGNIVDNTYQLTSKGSLFWENSFYIGVVPLILGFIALVFGFKKNQYLKFFSVLILVSLIIALHNSISMTSIFQKVIPGFKYFRIHQRILFLLVFSLCISAGFCLEFIKRKNIKFSLYLIILLLVLTIADLFKFGIKQNLTFDAKKWLATPKSVEVLRNLKDKDFFRINSAGGYIHKQCFDVADGYKHAIPYFVYRELLKPHSNMVYHIPALDGRGGLETRRIKDFKSFYSPKKLFLLNENTQIFLPEVLKLMKIQNCKYIVNGYSIAEKYEVDGHVYHEKDIELIANVLPEIAAVYVWKAPKCMPRSYVVPQAELVNEEKNILPTMVSEDFDPEKTVILEKEIKHGSSLIKNSQTVITKYENTEVEIDTNLTADGFLVLSDTYYPGWKVFVDDKEQEILRANYLFRAVPLKKGSHIVKFVFEPNSYKIGKYISIITFLVMIPMVTYCGIIDSKKNRLG